MHLVLPLSFVLHFLILSTNSSSIPFFKPFASYSRSSFRVSRDASGIYSGLPSLDTTASSTIPLIIWHGLGDSIENDGLKSVAALVNKTIPHTHVHLISLGGDDPSADRSATFFGNLTLQIQDVCSQLSSDPALANAPAVNALGFSQGGQFLRGYVERCNNPPVRNLVTFGSQHNGISQFQSCKPGDWVCLAAEALLKGGTWTDFVQSRLVPAQYYRDPEKLEEYLEHSNFLADVNNERSVKNLTYRKNLASLNRFAMYIFEEDTTAIPKESGWFSEVNSTSGEVTKLQDRQMYKEDWLGLKELDEKGALDFNVVKNAGHMDLSEKLLVNAFKTYFAPVSKKSGIEAEAEADKENEL